MDSIISIVQNLGFPVACCVFMGFYLKKISSDYREDVKSITDDYKGAIKSFQKALEKNTLILTELNIRLKETTERE